MGFEEEKEMDQQRQKKEAFKSRDVTHNGQHGANQPSLYHYSLRIWYFIYTIILSHFIYRY